MSERPQSHLEPRPHKVAVVGTGKVGSTFAYALLLEGLVGVAIEDVYLSLPAQIGRSGVERVLNLPLSEEESSALRRSADVLRGVLDELEL